MYIYQRLVSSGLQWTPLNNISIPSGPKLRRFSSTLFLSPPDLKRWLSESCTVYWTLKKGKVYMVMFKL